MGSLLLHLRHPHRVVVDVDLLQGSGIRIELISEDENEITHEMSLAARSLKSIATGYEMPRMSRVHSQIKVSSYRFLHDIASSETILACNGFPIALR